MPQAYLNPKELFPSVEVGFSQIVTSQGGKTVHIAGQTAWDANRQIVGGEDLKQQTEQIFKNIEIALKTVGGTMDDLVFLRLYIVDYHPDKFAPILEVMRGYLSAENPPGSTLVGVQTLASPDFLIEIEATAVLE